ncbi:MAG TPA: ATP-binding protein [Gemmatimonadaceae bacterium]|nr:ATP-binding protein [Gemmatimonadaceae bacterium]
MVSERPPRSPPAHERRILLLAALAGLPPLLLALALLWFGDYSTKLRLTLLLVAGGTWLIVTLALREAVVRPLQTLSNMLAALREEDFSIRARGARADDALGLAFLEANTLGETLRAQRLGAVETSALMRQVMDVTDVALFAFDADGQLRLANRAGEQLLDQPLDLLLGRDAASLGLADCLEGEAPRTMNAVFPGAAGRWEIRRSDFRQHGRPHTLLVLSDLSRTLREEELAAWQRLVRVLSHEINNSLAPIKSIAGSLRAITQRAPRPADLDADLRTGLSVIEGRAEALGHFIASYARLTRLPPPTRTQLDVETWVRRVVALETRLPVSLRPGPATSIRADGDQLDQLLINLVRNAVDAALETHGGVSIEWRTRNGTFELRVEDEGPGLANTANLFVPFFTTKPSGSGIGLALSRQIAEAHGGTLELENRRRGRGVEARLRLPMSAK